MNTLCTVLTAQHIEPNRNRPATLLIILGHLLLSLKCEFVWDSVSIISLHPVYLTPPLPSHTHTRSLPVLAIISIFPLRLFMSARTQTVTKCVHASQLELLMC